MGKKLLALLGTLGFLSPVVSLLLAITIVVIVVATIVIVYIAMFNQDVFDRLFKLITAMSFLSQPKGPTKKN